MDRVIITEIRLPIAGLGLAPEIIGHAGHYHSVLEFFNSVIDRYIYTVFREATF